MARSSATFCEHPDVSSFAEIIKAELIGNVWKYIHNSLGSPENNEENVQYNRKTCIFNHGVHAFSSSLDM